MGVPPVIVAHSFGASMALKYLESYPAQALVLLNPYPVTISKSFKERIHTLQTRSPPSFLLSEEGRPGLASDPESSQLFGSEYPSTALEEFSSNPPRFETGAIPMLILGSTQDQIVTEQDIRDSAAALEVVDPADLKMFVRSGHSLMLDVEAREAASYMLQWLHNQNI
eukprot:GILK01014671.1.p1 GENE.GILK01014671.1~~GILK01014671.1.p1  ORF type:complete len:168 (+),score=23.85 GILK01014671.1:373-876(+)